MSLVSDSDTYIRQWIRQWLVTYSTQSHYSKQCWYIVNCTFRNRSQRNLNRNSSISYHSRKCVKNVVCEMIVILLRRRRVNHFSPQHLPLMRPKTFSGNKRFASGVTRYLGLHCLAGSYSDSQYWSTGQSRLKVFTKVSFNMFLCLSLVIMSPFPKNRDLMVSRRSGPQQLY